MKTTVNVIIFVIAIGVGLMAGSIWKRHHGPRGANESARALETTNNDLIRGDHLHRKSIRRSFDDSPLATELERRLSSSSGVTNWLCWMDALEKAQPSDFPRLLRLARGHPAAWDIVANRWSEIAPRQMFDTLVAAAKTGSDLPITELG